MPASRAEPMSDESDCADELAAIADADLVAELRKSYEPSTIPPCRVCGGKLTMASVGGGTPTAYACSDPRTPEGKMDWNHYSQSRWEDYRRGGDDRVLELLRRFETARAAGGDAARWQWGVEHAAWIRHEHVAYVAIPVARGADLSCKAFRVAAVDDAMAREAQPTPVEDRQA